MPTTKEPRLTKAQIWLVDYLQSQMKKRKEDPNWVVTEYRFHPSRKWKFDVAIPHWRIGFECDGGKWHGGHRRGKALEDDYERQNTAIMEGWRVLRFTNEQILDKRGWAHQFLNGYF